MRNSVLCYLEDTAKKYPEKLAISDGNKEITFSQWRNEALCIARAIKEKVNQTKIPVLIYLPKSTDILVAFAGVLYSGNFYTPTDVKFPFPKVNSILECLQPKLIISDKKSAQKLIENGIPENKFLFIEDINLQEEAENSEELLNQIIDTDLAYVLFTSGSTGVPKGVAISQRSIMDYIDWLIDEFDITEKEVIANQAPFYFDNSILDIYLCMSQGATLYITPEKKFLFVSNLLEYLESKKVNMIFWVPSALVAVANSGLLGKHDLSNIKKVLFCGEVMPNKQLNVWRKELPEAIYANLYGPTEITDVCAYYRVNREFADDEPLPIGNACKNTDIILLDDNNEKIEEADKIGELCVRGTSLSVGYFSNEEKTKQVFIQNPLNPYYKELIYCTGDLAHYNEYGEIMFDGRKDFQIKHRGYRIELGEIETAILGLEDIETACCVYDNAKQEIVLFYVGTEEADRKYIRKKLVNQLPSYMFPTGYYKLEKLPYNDNGKIDRKELANTYL